MLHSAGLSLCRRPLNDCACSQLSYEQQSHPAEFVLGNLHLATVSALTDAPPAGGGRGGGHGGGMSGFGIFFIVALILAACGYAPTRTQPRGFLRHATQRMPHPDSTPRLSTPRL